MEWMKGDTPLQVLIVDDHRMFGDSLRFLLEQKYPAVNLLHATNAEQALTQLEEQELPDVILLDLKLPGVGGQEFLKQLQEREIWAPTLVVSASRSMMDAETALSNGALGFVSKEATGEELIGAIETVINGGVYNYFKQRQVPVDTGGGGDITPRQREVLHMLSQGYANKNIADQLGISEHTVKAHLHEIFRILKVHNRTACVKEAERLGLL
jgi:DNA-binding NarL/FixJ family response regulator